MLLQRKQLNPLALLGHVGEEIDGISRFFDDFSHFYGFPTVRGVESPIFSPHLDFVEKENNYELTIEVPGIEQKNIDIEITEDNTIVVKGEKIQEKEENKNEIHVSERYYGSFRRELKLPNRADADKINASYKNGILTIDIPKKEEEKPKIKKIEIN
ncbi:MAG TPA: Hsp20/alpha crystallin family protein [Candidatus Paceibacterota bacterium]|nr:Hsp20/alpha crystallin family protein [Candidatus Paceibacterota bacterium]